MTVAALSETAPDIVQCTDAFTAWKIRVVRDCVMLLFR